MTAHRLHRAEVDRALQAVVPADATIVVLHASLIGLGCDPADLKWSLLAPIRALVDRGATVALPTFTFTFCEGADFDRARSRSESGQLGDWLLELEGAQRTAHPIYSFAVLGPRAEEILDCASSTTFGPGSPFGLFDAADARIVMLGADWSFCTQFHHYEERAAVPYRTYKTFQGSVIDGDGTRAAEARMFVRDLDVDAANNFGTAIAKLRRAGAIEGVALAEGRVEAVSCSALGAACAALLADNPLALVDGQPTVERRLAHARIRRAEPAMRLAVIGQRNLTFLRGALEASASCHIEDRSIDVFAPDYGQSWQAILAPDSALNREALAATFFVDRLEDVLGVGRLDEVDDHQDAIETVAGYAELIAGFADRVDGLVVVNRFARLRPATAGQADSAAGEALVADANACLASVLEPVSGVHLFDLAAAAARYDGAAIDERIWHLGRFPFSQGFSAALARRFTGLLLAATGRAARLLVADLDGTLWGGVLGEDGIEGLQLGGDWPGNAYLDLQKVLKGLAARGLAVAICSKNDEDHVREATETLSQMAFRLEDAVSLRINWRPKWQNVVEIADELNLGLDHIAFLDDNPVEREQMRRQLPAVKVVDLPDDPCGFVAALLDNPYLECLVVTAEDRKRVSSYQGRARLESERRRFTSMDEFYASLKSRLHLYPLAPGNIQRAAQLMAKTNQFNTTTQRYDAAALRAIEQSPLGAVFVIGLEDRFTQLENIGVAVLKFDVPRPGIAEIDDLLLSCRVLGRGVEHALLHWLRACAAARGMSALRGRIVPSERNTPVRDLFAEQGFAPAAEDGAWDADITGGQTAAPDWIQVVDHCRERELAHA